MNNELVNLKENKELMAKVLNTSWGTEDLDSKDIKIPRLLLMQQMSDLVIKKKAQSGDMVDNVSGLKLGDEKTPLEVMLIDTYKNWIISEKGPKEAKFKYKQIVSWKEGNPNWKFEEKEGDITIRRTQCLNFYVLPCNSLDGMPLLLTFRSTGYKTGRKVATFAAQAKMLGKPMAFRTLLVGCTTESNDLGTYYVFTAEPGRVTKPEELAKAYQWYQTIRNQTVSVAEDGEVDPSETVVEEGMKF